MPEETITALCPQHKDKFRNYIKYNRKLIFLHGFIVLSIFIPRCSNNSDTDDYPFDFLTDQTNYLSADTINIVITNNSKNVLYIGLRCGDYLEMFYQKRGEAGWSENRYFGYMSLLCPTVIDSILFDESYSYELPAEWFDDVGTFRLVMDQLYSIRFTID